MTSIDCPHCGSEDYDVTAQREDVPFAIGQAPREVELNVSVILPVYTCNSCKQEWTDQAGSVIREFAVREARISYRPPNYHKLSDHHQWEIDKLLGILDA